MKMVLDFLERRLRDGDLPGSKAHQMLKATPLGKIKPKFEHQDPPRPGSVLILLYDDDGIRFPLIKRPNYQGLHSGQVSLPGGKSEPGEDLIQTALREANEEIGVLPEKVHVLGTLSPFFVIPSNFMITPVVSMTKEKPDFIPDPHEVERILTASLDQLLQEDAIKETEIQVANRYAMMAPHFEVEGEIVWGATAMMLNELREILREFRAV